MERFRAVEWRRREEGENEGRTDREGDREMDSLAFNQTGRQTAGHLIRQGDRKREGCGRRMARLQRY